jgi:transposase
MDSGRSIVDVARSIQVSEQTLGKWVNKYRESRPELPPTPADRAEMERLRKENMELRMENEFLKKAAAWFAKHVQ